MSFQEMEIKTEIEMVEDCRPLDMQRAEPSNKVEGVPGGSNDDVIKRADDVSNISFDHEDKIPIKIEFKQEIKSEPLDKVERGIHEGLNDDLIKRAEDNSNICFVQEGKILAKKEIKQEVKNELWDEVEEVHEDYVIKRALDVPNICFGHGDTVPIKKEIKQEIKNEPLDEDNMDC